MSNNELPLPEYRQRTLEAYNIFAEQFDLEFKSLFDKKARVEADEFMKLLPGKDILDLCSGSGHQALYFKTKGYSPLCVDGSIEMIKRCSDRGLIGETRNIEDLSLLNGNSPTKFDGIWFYNSLVHLPKRRWSSVCDDLSRILDKNGILALSIPEGEHSRYEQPLNNGAKLFFNYGRDQDIVESFGKKFKVFSSRKDKISNGKIELTNLKYLLKLK